MSDDDFEPRLGKMRSGGSSKKARKYLARVVAATVLTASGKRGGVRRFDGSRIGRGASLGRVLGSRDRFGGTSGRRVIVKTRLVKLAGKGGAGARAHLRYIQRDGVTREGAPGELYGRDVDRADGKAFLDRATGDRHQFRFIVSAEDGADYTDLKPLTRRLMGQMESDLGTKLDWVAVDHFNTGHPHTHIMLRGVDDRGQNLIVAREYIAHGLRARAEELVTLDLGPRTQQEIEAGLRQDIRAERLTAIDRRVLRDMSDERMIGIAMRDPFQQSLRAGRLQALGEMGLAEHLGDGRWRVADALEDTLRAMGERGDIIRALQRDLSEAGLAYRRSERQVYDPGAKDATSLIGRVVRRGLADEHRDRHYLVIDGIDGRAHYVPIGRGDVVEPLPSGAIVEIVPSRRGFRDVDRTIIEIAARTDGYYSVDLHLRHDPSANEAFAESHVRRLEAIRRASGGPERDADGRWRIGPDHQARVEAYEARVVHDRPVDVRLLSSAPLEQLPHANAATWLDRVEMGGTRTAARDGGFGREMRNAQMLRRQWLLEQGLAAEQGDGTIRYAANHIANLQRRELMRTAAQMAENLGLEFVEARTGTRIEGVLAQRLDLVSGRFALVENEREFTLVPWRPVLERQLGRPVSGIMRGDGVSWSFGRGRAGPSIS